MPFDATLGEISLFSFSRPMRDWMVCDGAILPVNKYQALYALLGNNFGGTPGSTFALPDLRGCTPVGLSAGTPPSANLTAYSMGARGGVSGVTLTQNTMPSHTHPLMGTTHQPNSMSIIDSVYANVGTAPPEFSTPPALYGALTSLTNFDAQAIDSRGGGQSHENMQPSLTLCFMICVNGAFPSRQ